MSCIAQGVKMEADILHIREAMWHPTTEGILWLPRGLSAAKKTPFPRASRQDNFQKSGSVSSVLWSMKYHKSSLSFSPFSEQFLSGVCWFLSVVVMLFECLLRCLFFFFKKNKRFFFFFVVMVVHFSKIMWTQQHFGEAVLQPRLLQNLLLPRRSQLYLYIHIKAVHFEHPEDQNFRGEETHGAWEGQQLFPAHTTTQPLYLSGCKCGSSKGKSANGSCSPRCHEDNLAFEGAHSPWQLLPRGDALSLSFSSVWLHLLSAEIDLSSTGRNCWKAQRKNLAEARLGAKSCLCTSMQEAAAQNRSLGGGYFGKATTDWGKACVGQGLAPNSVTNRHKSTEPSSLAASLA